MDKELYKLIKGIDESLSRIANALEGYEGDGLDISQNSFTDLIEVIKEK
jgi:hypothetical protein